MLIGALLIMIAASVSPADVEAVLPEALALVAGTALVSGRSWSPSRRGARPTLRERAFVGWMAPRGIVAGATASAFGIQLTQAGLAGRGRSSLTFVAILGSVVL